MTAAITLRPLTDADIEAHNAGEDDEVIRWLSGRASTVESTRRHIATLAANAEAIHRKRGWGIWWDERLAGYIDADPESTEVPAPGDVNIAYSVHPWARRQGVASAAVQAVCRRLEDEHVGRRAIIRADRRNAASIAVALHCSFAPVGEALSPEERDEDGRPVVYQVFARDLNG